MTFFSGTDTSTLLSEGSDCNNFVSLIVNNIGEYTAAITRKITKKVISEETTFNFFGEGERVDSEEYTEEENNIEWFKLKIEKEGTPTFSDIASRIEEVKKSKLTPKPVELSNKKVEVPLTTAPRFSYNYFDEKNKSINDPYDDYPYSYNSYRQTYNTGNNKQTAINFGTDFDVDVPNKPTVDKEVVESLVRQLITGSIIIPNGSKLEIEKWIKSMPSLYSTRFGKGKEGLKLFQEWVETFADFITFNVKDKKLEAEGYKESSIYSLYTEAILERFKSLPSNEYTKIITDALEEMIIL